MFLAKCSSCNKSDIYLKLKVPGNCINHLFCSDCYKSNPILPAACIFDCVKCSDFYRSILNPREIVCDYCHIVSRFDLTCSVHNVCNVCLFSWSLKQINGCYKCKELSKFTCYSCKILKPLKTVKCPTHFKHRYCWDCFTKFKYDFNSVVCQECKKAFKKTKIGYLCLICKRKAVEIGENRCRYHSLCLQCIYLLNKPPYLFLHLDINSCHECTVNTKLDFGNICQNCIRPLKNTGSISLKLIMLTCKFKHAFCIDCYTQKGLGDIISCKHCAFFFKKSEADEIVCMFCKRVRLNNIQLDCKDCIICEFCMLFIKENNPIRYLQSMLCQEGQFNLCKLLEIPLDSIIEDKKHLEDFKKRFLQYYDNNQKVNCHECRKQIDYLNFCNIHPLCKNCFNSLTINRNKKCNKCINIFQTACKNCFSVVKIEGERIVNLACKKNPKDFYCSICFVDIKTSRNCSCTACLQLYEPCNKNCCYLCKKKKKIDGDFWCSQHRLCIDCQFSSNYILEIYKNNLGCENCKLISITESFGRSHEIAKHKFSNFEGEDEKKQVFTEEKKFENSLYDSQTLSSRKLTGKNEKYFINYPKADFAPNPCQKSIENSLDSAEKLNAKTESSLKNHGDYIGFISQENPSFESLNLEKGQNISNPIEKINESFQVKLEEMMKPKCEENSKYIICCGQSVQKNECGHPICKQCLEKLFEKKFNYFISLILEGRLEVLNNTSWEIGCFKEECYLKVCFPFSLFEHIAKRIVIEKRLPEEISTHFDLCFEGIKYYFYKCTKCNYYTGDKPGKGCMWCPREKIDIVNYNY